MNLQPTDDVKRDGLLRVAVVPERYGNVISPCASIRLYSYFDLLRREGLANIRFLLPSEIERFGADVIVWHRVSLPDVEKVRWMRALSSRISARMIYDIDDNLLDMEGHDESDSYAAMGDAVRESLASADEVWCSTPNLARRVAIVGHGRVRVLPNTLDPDIWRLHKPPRNVPNDEPSLRLLYMGTRTHDHDYGFLKSVMEELHRQLPGSVELYLIGVRSTDADIPPWLRVWSTPTNAGASYPAFVHWLIDRKGFDLGVAPLIENTFNNCKSPIKVLDYAAIGIPTLASDMPAYTHSLDSGVNCFHAVNEVDAWVDKLRELILMHPQRREVYGNARRLISTNIFRGAAMERLSLLGALANEGTC